MKPGTKNELLPMYGIDEHGRHHSDWAFTDIDASPSKSFIIENRMIDSISPYFALAVDKHPEFELYNVQKDPYCLTNLIENNAFSEIENELKSALISELTETKDPRIVGPDKEIFDSYKRYSPMREFPE